MPELCRFRGMVITMRFSDDEQHHKPHIHVVYGGESCSIGLDGVVLAGMLPAAQLRKLTAWITLREDELYKAWTHAIREEPIDKIDP